MAKIVNIEAGDKVCVDFEGTPYMGIVDSINGKEGKINFDNGDTEDHRIADMKLISKGGQEADLATDVTATEKKPAAASPSAQKLEQMADKNRKGQVDAINKAKAVADSNDEKKMATVPLTQEEKDFMAEVEPKMNGGSRQENGQRVVTARMTSMPASADILRYSKLLKRKDVK